MKNKLVPEIRFKGFTNAWERKELLDCILSSFSGSTPNTNIKEFYNGDKNFSTINDISFANKYLYKTSKKITQIAVNSCNLNLLKPNNLMIAMYASYGKVAINTIETHINQAILALETPNAEFLYYRLLNLNINNVWNKVVSNGVQSNLNKQIILKHKIIIANEKENNLISHLLSKLDNTISLLQRKLEKLENIKNTLLEKMFASQNNPYPEIRFKGFTNAWEQKNSTELLTTYSIKNNKNKSLISYSISNKFGFVSQKEYFINGGSAVNGNKKNSKVITAESFAFNPSRINVGSISYYPFSENGLISNIYETFQTTKLINNNFFAEYLKTDNFKHIIKKSSTSGVREIFSFNKNDTIFIKIPSVNEQTRIASFYLIINSCISLLQRKLEKLENIKNTLLEKMFA
ncbi:restriction endonuclease subunit S [Mycoplasma zalophidermidis]|uniref:Restriction endonuclease subunit S n=1 Tax=Mycoplasma zalophidermidis TaxID=398174 RepID=A0ABS6DSD0_9MOLU|nr:restriction endonuclease subunit S [Mycoplasma zalophidermidis]MBU4693927.1 restriction endonuclease subunit S [Mycoplasma zalophidermidis]